MLDLGGAQARISLDITDFMGNLKTAEGAANRFDGSLGGATGKIQKMSGEIDLLGKGFLGIGLGILGIGGFGIKAAAQFDQGMANIQAATGVTGADLDTLRQKALDVGKDTTFGATDATVAIEGLGLAGLSTEQIMDGALDSVVALAEASGIRDLGVATDYVTGAMNAFGISGSDSIRIVDALANGASFSSAEVSDLASGLAYVGTTAHSLNIPLEDTIALLGLLNDQNIRGSSAGTALNQAFTSLLNPSGPAMQAFSDLGLSNDWMKNADGSFKNMTDLITTLDMATKNLSTTDRGKYLDQIFGEQGGKAINAILNAQSDSAKAAGKSWQDYLNQMDKTGTAAEMAKARMNSFSGDMEAFKGTLETISITIGSYFIPFLRMGTQALTGLLGGFLNLPAPIQKFIALTTGAIGVVSLLAGGFLLALPRIMAIRDALGVLRTAMVGTKFAPLATAFSALLPILAVAAIGVAAFALAYKLNLGGIADKTNAFIKGFGISWKAFENDNIASRVFKSISGGLWFLADTFPALQGPLRDLSIWFRQTGDVLQDVGDYFHKAFGNDTQSLLKTLPKPIQGIARGIGTVLDTIGDFGRAYKKDGMMGVLRAIPKEVGDLGIATRRFMSGVGDLFRNLAGSAGPFEYAVKAIGTAFDDLGEIVKDVGMIIRRVLEGDFKSAGKWAKRLIGDVGDLLADSFDILAGAIGGAGSAIRAISKLIRGIPIIGRPAARALDWVADAAENIGNKMADTVSDYRRYRDQGVNPLAAAARALSDNFKVARDVLNSPVTAGVIYGIQNLFRGDFQSALSNFKAAWEGLPDVFDAAWQGIQNFGNALGGVAGSLLDWALDVGAPTAINFLFNIYSVIADKVVGVAVPLIDWTLDVAVPLAVDFLFSMATLILDKLDAVVVNLNEWVLNVDAHSAAVRIMNLVQVVSENSTAILAAVAIGIGVLTLGIPGVILLGFAALVIAEAKKRNPDNIAIGAITLVADSIDLVSNSGSLVGAITDEIGRELGANPIKIAEIAFWFDEHPVLEGALIIIIDLMTAFSGVVASAVEIWNNLSDAVSAVVGTMEKLGGPIKSTIDAFGDVVETAKKISGPVGDIVDAIQAVIETSKLALGPIQDIKDAWDGVLGVIKDIVGLIPGISGGDDKKKSKGNRPDLAKQQQDQQAAYAKALKIKKAYDSLGATGDRSGGGSGGTETPVGWIPFANKQLDDLSSRLGPTQAGLEALGSVKVSPVIDANDKSALTKLNAMRALNGTVLATAVVSIAAKEAGAGVVAGAKSAAQNALASVSGQGTTTTNTTILKAIDNASPVIATVMANVAAFVANSIGVMGGWTSGIGTMLSTVAGGFSGTLDPALATGGANFDTFASSASSAMSSMSSSVASGMSAASAAISSESGTWSGIIDGAAGSMGAAGYNAGAAAGFGVVNGLLSALGAVQAAAAQIAATVATAMAMALLIKSPSKVTTKLGMFAGLGLAAGLDQSNRNVTASSVSLSKAITGPLTGGAWDKITSSIGNISNLTDKDGKLSDQFKDMIDTLTGLADGSRKNTRGLISELTDAQKRLADYTVDDKHPQSALDAANKLSQAITTLTTGGVYSVGNGVTESYGLSDKFYGSKSPLPKKAPNQPTSQGNQGRTVYVDNRQFFAVKSSEFAKLQSDAEKGAQVHAGVSGLGSTSQTSRIRGTGVL